ncbi:MAG TPA: hypothetical protein VGM64_04270 [Lacunisphaera sp.]|jgi:hypothetical protein
MRTLLRGFISPLLTRREEIPISSCVHYCGFRYGRGEFNPYENYVIALSNGESLQQVRERFEDFLQHYRPENFGEALGISLTRAYPMWEFPWFPRSVRSCEKGGWFNSPSDVPDIITHFSKAGISRHRIDEEFSWLERAYFSIREVGYQPSRFAGHISALKLINDDGDSRYLILDGNHRMSALVALGISRVTVAYRIHMTVRVSRYAKWPQVVAGFYSKEDARRVFEVYFLGNLSPRTTENAAPIISGKS